MADPKENVLKLITTSPEPFDKCIRQFIMTQFPSKLCGDRFDLIDLISYEILGTKQVRLGPKPSPETQVKIRDVIRHYMDDLKPIPFMVPWGSEKPDGSSIDIAELGALKTLLALQERAKAHYTPGLQFNIRVEDASAPHLFNERAAQAWEEADRYSTAFANLVAALDLQSFIAVKRESSAVTVEQFNVEADAILPFMHDYLIAIADGGDGAGELLRLERLGWKGAVHEDTMGYYLSTYEKMYPNMGPIGRISKLARYFAGALARARMGIRGDSPEWDGMFIDLSFVQNPPGTDARFSRRVLYRTLPGEYTSNHIPPWRAKGYLEINEDGHATPKLASYNNLSSFEFNKRTITLKRGNLSVDLQADYILA